MSDPSASLEQLARAAIEGDRGALETLVRALQDPIYGLCLRMLGAGEDARDACQEISIKIVTRLSSFRGQSKLRTWAYRIAVNHLLDLARRPSERIEFVELDRRLAAPPQDVDAHAPVELLEREVFLGCTLAMLRCLDRDHRLAFILGAILELEGPEAAAVLELSSPATFRKRLSRARARLDAFMRPRCGVANPDAPCRCRGQINANIERGLLQPTRLRLATAPERARAGEHVREVAAVVDSVELLRRHPDYAAPADLVDGLRGVLRASPLAN